MEILEGKQRQNRREEIFEEIMTKISKIQKYSNLTLKVYTELNRTVKEKNPQQSTT